MSDTVEVGIVLDPATPTQIYDYGARQIVILGTWNGAAVVVERRLPEHAGDPPGGNWAGVPWSAAVDAPRQPAEPYTEHNAPRIYFLYEAQMRARVVAAAGRPAPKLVMAIGKSVEA
jgi:hypothetical protein